MWIRRLTASLRAYWISPKSELVSEVTALRLMKSRKFGNASALRIATTTMVTINSTRVNSREPSCDMNRGDLFVIAVLLHARLRCFHRNLPVRFAHPRGGRWIVSLHHEAPAAQRIQVILRRQTRLLPIIGLGLVQCAN